MTNEISVVLFDLGRVLMHIDFDAFPRGLGIRTEKERRLYEHDVREIVHAYERGRWTTNDFLDRLFDLFDGRYTRETIRTAYDDIIVDDDRTIIPLIQRLREKYTIAILSNTSPSHWEKILRISSVIQLFPHTFTSFQIGEMKPHPMVYHTVCATLSVAPQQVLFIDDMIENVNGAEQVGMHAEIFRTVHTLKHRVFHT